MKIQWSNEPPPSGFYIAGRWTWFCWRGKRMFRVPRLAVPLFARLLGYRTRND